MAGCSAITRNGERCKGMPIDGSDLCYVHNPATREQRARDGRKGGKKGGRGRPLAELRDLKGELREIREAVRTGRLEPGRATVMVQSTNAEIRCLNAEREW